MGEVSSSSMFDIKEVAWWEGMREREMPMINFPTFWNVCPEEEKLVPKFPYGSVICSFFLSLAE